MMKIIDVYVKKNTELEAMQMYLLLRKGDIAWIFPILSTKKIKQKSGMQCLCA